MGYWENGVFWGYGDLDRGYLGVDTERPPEMGGQYGGIRVMRGGWTCSEGYWYGMGRVYEVIEFHNYLVGGVMFHQE